MSANDIGPGKVLEGFQSLIFKGEDEEHTPVLENTPQVTANAAPQSSYQQKDGRQEKLTEVAPRRLPQIFRQS